MNLTLELSVENISPISMNSLGTVQSGDVKTIIPIPQLNVFNISVSSNLI